MIVVTVETYFVRQPERQRGEELRRQLWWPCPSSSLRRAPLGALTVQSVPAFRPTTTTTTSSRSLQRSTVGRGAVPGRWRPRVVPVCHPRTQTLPHPLAPLPPPRYLSPAFQSMLRWCSNKLSIFLRERHMERKSDLNFRGLLKTSTLEQN